MMLFKRSQGITLVEVLIAAGIFALVAATLSGAVFQVVEQTRLINGRVSAMNDLRIAGSWLTRDGERSESTDLVDLAAPVATMSLSWTSEGLPVSSNFYLSGTDLKRSSNGDIISIARNVSSVEFSIAGNLITIDLDLSTANGSIEKQARYHVFLRPTS